jgi:hypothetical protein
MRELTFLMILLSLFVGIPLNGNWSLLCQFEFVDFPAVIGTSASWIQIVLWVGLLLSHSGIFLLPFLERNRFFNKMLVYAPIVFLLCFTLLEFLFLFLLLPFIFCWVIAVESNKRRQS